MSDVLQQHHLYMQPQYFLFILLEHSSGHGYARPCITVSKIITITIYWANYIQVKMSNSAQELGEV